MFLLTTDCDVATMSGAVRYRCGYWLRNLQFGAIAFVGLGVALIFVAVLVAVQGSTGVGTVMGFAALCVGALGGAAWNVQQRWFVDVNDQQRTITVSSHRATTVVAFDEVSFRLPRSPSLMPTSVHVASDGTGWRKATALGQGQSKTPRQLMTFSEHLQRCGVAHEWV